MKAPIRILAVVPEPVDAGWSAIAAAGWASIEGALRGQVDAGAIEIVRLKPATANALDDLLGRQSFEVVHVVARGTSRPAARHGTLTLEGSDKRARELNAQNFAKLCARVPDLEVVVLQNAGGPPAELDVLRDAVFQQAASVVCAPSGSAADTRDATEFALAFYLALAAGRPLGEAFAVAARNPSGLPGTPASGRPGVPALLPRARPAGTGSTAQPRGEAAPPVAPPRTQDAVVPPVENAATAAQRQIAQKRAACAFDVFLCHNVGDKPAVMEIGRRLMASGVLPWLDKWELRPGTPWQRLLEEQIANIHAAAVFVGREGIGPWQRNELDGFLREFNKRGCPVIPVMLPGAGGEPDLPLFLRGMTWVDFRIADPDPLTQLIWGITGQRPPEPL